jgi:uncharacterized protein (DUF1800 family)
MRWFNVLECLLAAVLAQGAMAQTPSTADPLRPLPEADFTIEAARHLLARAGFGGTVEEAQRLQRLGLDAAVAWFVDYEERPDVVGPLELAPPPRIDREAMRNLTEEERRAAQNRLRQQDQQGFQSVRRWWMDRMLRSRRPLEEKLTVFWHGHFTSSYREVRSGQLMLQQNELLRHHASGNFGDLLHEVSKDPAMLQYLNNNQNRRGRPNENYAREVMELFTLGIGNYTEEDIREGARALTGWTFQRQTGRFLFDRRQHDDGVKTIFGKSGRFDGDGFCDLILAHPACAPYVAGKLFAFLAYDPAGDEPELRARLGQLLRDTGYELKPLLRAILKSERFYSLRARGQQVKSPLELMVSTVRMLGVEPPPPELLLQGAGRLGQDLMAPPNVKGWEGGTAWITTATLLERNNLCGALVMAGLPAERPPRPVDRQARQNEPPGRRLMDAAAYRRYQAWNPGFSACALAAVVGARDAGELVDGLAKRFLLVPLSAPARADLIRFLAGSDGLSPAEIESLQGAPAETKLRKLLHLLMSTPEFQVT